MSNQNYVNYYVEIMTSTMQDAILRNMSFQANAKISDDIIKDLQIKNDELVTISENLKKELELTKNSNSNAENLRIKALENSNNDNVNVINNLNTEINQLKNINVDYEKLKNQAQHVDTFRNELSKSRAEIETLHKNYEEKIDVLKNEIEYLKLTPAKRKKIDDAKASEPNDLNAIIKDGGSF